MEHELIAVYREAARRLRLLIREAVKREALGTAGYYARQHRSLEREIRRLGRRTSSLAPLAILEGYLQGLRIARLVEHGIPDLPAGSLEASFAGVHGRAVRVLIAALEGRLEDARVQVGRSADDVFRRVILQETAVTVAAGLGPRAQAKTARRALEQEGLTAFTDKRGAKWSLEVYTRMATRTETRAAATEATVREMGENGRDLVQISTHVGPCDICKPLEGKTYSLSGDDDRYPKATVLPPYHPNCRHVAFPATATFDDLERELGIV
jgi:hypothetical protein